MLHAISFLTQLTPTKNSSARAGFRLVPWTFWTAVLPTELSSQRELVARLHQFKEGIYLINWELRTVDCKITPKDKKRRNLTYYMSSESIRNAESE